MVLVMGAVTRCIPFGPDRCWLKSGVELVPLTVTVTDRAGRSVADLMAADTAIFEEGRGQRISHSSVRRKRGTGGDYRYARAHAVDDDETLSALPCE
jgi:hypothetical protein